MPAPDGTCPDPAHPIPSVPANRVIDPTQKGAFAPGTPGSCAGAGGSGGSSGGGGGSCDVFFCVPDDGSEELQAPLACPTDSSQLAMVEHLSLCLDQPVECLTPAQAQACGVTPNGKPCPGLLPDEVTKCGKGSQDAEGFQNAVDKVIAACAVDGQDVPTQATGGPRRYCFASCLFFNPAFPGPVGSGPDPSSNQSCEGSVFENGVSVPTTCYGSCDPTMFVDPSISASSLLIDVDPTASNAQISVQLGGSTFAAVVPIAGTIALDLPPECQGPVTRDAPCKASLPSVALYSTGPFSIAGTTVGQVSMTNPNLILGDVRTADARTELVLDAGQALYVSANVGGQPAQSTFTSSTPILFSIDWATRAVTMALTAQVPMGNATATIELRGTLPDLAPTAEAGPDQTLECASLAGTPATLSAAGSTDPDGAQDLSSFDWTAKVGCANWELGGEAVETPPLPLGTTHFAVQVTDLAGIAALAGTDVTVRDTKPPAFGAPELATDCLWPPDHEMHLFRLGQELRAPASDTCDATPFVRVVGVVSDQPATGGGSGDTPTDVRFGTGALCVRAERDGTAGPGRTYTVTLEVSDSAGNTAQEQVTIRVPHDQGRSPKCTTGAAAPGVANDDPRCVAAALDPHPPPPAPCAAPDGGAPGG